MGVIYIEPEYVERFHCDGTLCGSRCCKDWQVVIDPRTYERYAGMASGEEREEILSHILKADEKGNYPVESREDGSCPFLREDGLCRIQKERGEDFLSDICFSYPRVTYRIGDVVKRSLTMSCPVAARLLLGERERVRFRKREIDEARRGWQTDVLARVQRHKAEWMDLQSAGIWLLQDRRFSLDRRLFSLQVFFSQAELLLEQENAQGFQKLLEQVESGEYALRAAEQADGVKFRREEYIRMMMGIYHELYGAPMSEARERDLLAVYENCYPVFAKEFLQRDSHFFENYLVNEFFLRFYPYAFREQDLLEGNGRIFLLAWKVVEFALLMMRAQGPLDPERFLLGIDRMTERLDHNKGGMEAVRRYARDFSSGTTPEDFAARVLRF